MPGDNHCHNHGLATACCHLEGNAEKLWIGVGVELSEAVFDLGIAVLVSYLGQIDSGFQSFNLAEEKLSFSLRIYPVF